MADTSGSTWRPPDLLIKLGRLPWKTRKFFFGNVVLSLLVSGIVAWLFISENSLKGMHIEWVFQYRWWFLGALLAWFFITFVISGLFMLVPLGGPDTKRLEKYVKRCYLDQVRQDTELLTLKGIPAGLISESVHLDEVFIPLQFRPNRPRTDYPLTEKELEEYRELRRIGNLSVE